MVMSKCLSSMEKPKSFTFQGGGNPGASANRNFISIRGTSIFERLNPHFNLLKTAKSRKILL
ncbi:hypothetical protein BMS3Abin14_00692 [bacterium BMS3Abin14]|nr:hypothetical protein BMS3Abin14_00692 [bacterium BMS3Abin14]